MATIIRKRTNSEENAYKEWKADWIKRGSSSEETSPVETDPTGSWLAVIRMVGHAPIKKSFRLKSAAEKWVTDTEQKLNNDQDVSLSQKKLTLSEAMDRYLIEVTPFKEGAQQGGIENETRVFKQVRSLPLSKKQLTKIRKADIETVLAKWKRAGNESSTINRAARRCAFT